MQPGSVFRELFQEHGCGNGAAVASTGVLDVGDVGADLLTVVVVERKAPEALTGAVAVALGQVNAGIFSNDEDTFQHFTEGLTKSGERFWRLPLDDDYREQIRSDIADIKNTGGRWGGASTAAQFLQVFAGDTPWIHLDIAGMAWLDETKPWTAKGPTGVAVRSIVEWVRTYSK